MKKKPTKKPKKKVKENTLVLFPTVQPERIAKALESIDSSIQLQHSWNKLNELVDMQEDLVSLDTITITDVPGMKTSEIIEKMKSKFTVWQWCDNEQLDKDFPAPEEATTRRFLNQQEPDKETIGLSVRQCEEKGYKNMITLRERLLLEIAYFDATGKHMDVEGCTFCGGSRHSDGGVPRVFWLGSEVRVSWGNLGRSDAWYGIRSAV